MPGGVPFQQNTDTGDVRISGTFSSLAGLEEALEKEDDTLIENAVWRVNLLRSIQTSIGGIPLLYICDEWGMLNDYTYLTDPIKASDSRWVHRSRKRWEAREDLTDQDTLEWRFFHEMVKLFQLRKRLPAFRNGGMEVVSSGSPHLFAYLRVVAAQRILVVNNFHESPKTMSATALTAAGMTGEAGDLLSGERHVPEEGLRLKGYQSVWLEITAMRPEEA